jgi:hypothetical protein
LEDYVGRGIPMPDEDAVPTGPRRELLALLHDLYRRAGLLGTRVLSEAIKNCDECPDTVSHEGVSSMLHGKGLSSWPKLESLVRVLAMRAVDRPDPNIVVRTAHALWLDAAETSSHGTAFPASASSQINQTASDDRLSITRVSSSRRYAVDIVLCLDVTGSMSPIIDEAKSGAFSFHSQLNAAMRRKGKNVSQMRIRVIAYRDFGADGRDALQVTPFFKMPDQARSFESFVRSLATFGGGDEPESGLEALSVAIESEWERGFDLRRHVIVLFTDASAHSLGGPERALAQYPPGMPESLSELANLWGNTEMQTSVMDDSAKRLLLFAPDVSPWTEISTEWDNVLHFVSQAGSGLGALDFKEILDAIASSV